MKKTFTSEYIRSNRGCYSEEMVASLSFINKGEITILDILNSEMPWKDKSWFLTKKCELTSNDLCEFAIVCAETVLPIYEAKYPDNKAPRQAIEAAKAYLRNEISLEKLREYRIAASFAAYTSHADNETAAYAAAYATVYSASYSTADAADTAADEHYKEKLLSATIDFVNSK